MEYSGITPQEAMFRLFILLGLATGVLSIVEFDVLPDGTVALDVGLPPAAPGSLTPLYNRLALISLLLPATRITDIEFTILPRITGAPPPAPPPEEDKETPRPTLVSLW
ncbi:MAG: hypothetical protein QMC81_09310 [Thermoanaerobacterales bacterium]|nr:hypothetical protein [Bacillota bacterium]MDI6907665.1 hypothetical protein [Thermoanaerobacterales bacterium]